MHDVDTTVQPLTMYTIVEQRNSGKYGDKWIITDDRESKNATRKWCKWYSD